MFTAMDIGNKYAKILKGTLSRKGIVLISDFIKEEMPKNAVENGYIKKQADIILFLKNIINKAGLKKSRCCVTIRSSDIISKEIIIPAVSYSKIKKIIKNEALAVFGNVSRYYIDYVINSSKYKNMVRATVYAIPKELVSSYYEVLNMVKLKPVVFDVHKNSINKIFDGSSVINNNSICGKAIIFVDLGAEYMNFDLIADGNIIFERSIPIEELDGEFAIQGWNNAGLKRNAYFQNVSLKDSQDDSLFLRITEELYKIIQYSALKGIEKPVSNIYLYGGNSRIHKIDQYLSNMLEIPVEKITSISKIKTELNINIADIAAAAGSIIRR